MPLLPFAEKAIVPIEKLQDYVLNVEHSEGKHKAYLFKKILDISVENAEELRELILHEVLVNDAIVNKKDSFGQRYSVDFEIDRNGNTAQVRTGWILKTDELIPRLTTCYIL